MTILRVFLNCTVKWLSSCNPHSSRIPACSPSSRNKRNQGRRVRCWQRVGRSARLDTDRCWQAAAVARSCGAAVTVRAETAAATPRDYAVDRGCV